MSARPAVRQVPRAYLGLTALLSGALVMVIEMMGSRVVGPVFGIGIFVWTALISVTLVALAAGYAIGGLLADRRTDGDLLYGLLASAGLLCLLVPLLKLPVLEVSAGLGVRVGPLLATTVLFGPVLVLLGCVTPFVARLALDHVGSAGRTVGSLYALSTIGSVAGTLATGFVLIAHIGVNDIFRLASGGLIAMAVGWFVTGGRPWTLVLLLAPTFAAVADPPGLTRMDDGTEARVIDARTGFYGDVRVIEYSHGTRRLRELTIDGLVQGGIDPANGRSVYEYPYVIDHLLQGAVPAARSALVIGLGPGVLPARLAARGVTTAVVDIDPVVVDMARRHFAFPPTLPVHVADARAHLAGDDRAYDLVVLDVFNGDATPAHLMSHEALALVAARLAPGGAMAANVVGRLRGDTEMTRALLGTMAAHFDTVKLYPLFDPDRGDGDGNLVVVAYRGPDRGDPGPLRDPATVHPMAANGVGLALARGRSSGPLDDALVLRDDYNPVDVRDAELRETVRRDVLETTGLRVLLGAAVPEGG